MPEATEPIQLRPEVAAFAEAMELRLREFDGKPGKRSWHDDSDATLFRRAYAHIEHLNPDLHGGRLTAPHLHGSPSDMIDVGNYMMMIWDKALTRAWENM